METEIKNVSDMAYFPLAYFTTVRMRTGAYVHVRWSLQSEDTTELT